MASIPERRDSLWWLALPAAIWIAHFGIAYGVIAVWCAKIGGRQGALGPVEPVFWGLTGLAVLGLVGTGLRGWRRYGQVPAETPDADTDIARYRFLGLSMALLSALALAGIGYVALSFVLVGTCG